MPSATTTTCPVGLVPFRRPTTSTTGSAASTMGTSSRGVITSSTRSWWRFLRRHLAGVGQHDHAQQAAPAQHRVARTLRRRRVLDEAGDGRVVEDDARVGRHHVGRGQAVEVVAGAGVGQLGRRRPQEEAAQQEQPQPEKARSRPQVEEAHDHQGHAEGLSGPGSGTGGGQAVALAVPQPGPQDAAPVEGEGGDEVEGGHHHVEAGDVLQHAVDALGPAVALAPGRDGGRDAGQHQRQPRPRGRDPELLARGTGRAADVGDAAQQPQGDPPHGQALPAGGGGVGQLVQTRPTRTAGRWWPRP